MCDLGFVLEGGELQCVFYYCVLYVFELIVVVYLGSCIVCVVYGGVFDCVYCFVNGIELLVLCIYQLFNISINVVDYVDGCVQVVWWVDVLYFEVVSDDDGYCKVF